MELVCFLPLFFFSIVVFLYPLLIYIPFYRAPGTFLPASLTPFVFFSLSRVCFSATSTLIFAARDERMQILHYKRGFKGSMVLFYFTPSIDLVVNLNIYFIYLEETNERYNVPRGKIL